MKKLALFLVLVLLMGSLTACGGESTATTEVDTARFVGEWTSTSKEGVGHDLYSFRLLPSGRAVMTTYAILGETVTVTQKEGGREAHWEVHDNNVYLFPVDDTFDFVIILRLGADNTLLWEKYTYVKESE